MADVSSRPGPRTRLGQPPPQGADDRRRLQDPESEFDDISISKIRYLEDQKLLTPRRTPGGYRLYSQSDVERLRTILRLQRDEFLPLRVIRQELAAGGDIDLGGRRRATAARRAARCGGRSWSTPRAPT